MTAAAFMAADLLFFHYTRELSRSDLVEVSGIVERADYVHAPAPSWSRRRPTDHVDVWLSGWEFPFRFAPEWSHLATLQSGTPFRMGLKPDDMTSPLKPSFLRPAPSYRPLTVIMPDALDVRFTEYNQAARQNLQLFPWLSPLFALLALMMSSRAFTDRLEAHNRSKYAPKRKPLKGRLTFRLLKPMDDHRSK